MKSTLRTSLGKEGAEALIRVGGLALVGQVSIGLHRDNASVGLGTIISVG